MSRWKKIIIVASLGLSLTGCAVEVDDEVSDLSQGLGFPAEGAQPGASEASQHFRGLSLAPAFAVQHGEHVLLKDAHVAVAQGTVSSMKDLAPTLEAVARVGKPLVLVTTEPLSAQLTEELAALNHAGLMQVYAVTAKGAETDGAGSLERLLHVTLATRLDAHADLLQVTLEDLGYVKAIQLGADGLTIVPGR